MIGTTDIANLLFTECTAFGIQEVCQPYNIPKGEITAPRITIHVGKVGTQTYFNKGYANVNISIPDIDTNADLITLQTYERMCWSVFKEHTSEWEDTLVRLKTDSTEILEDKTFRCHYVNARIFYEIINA